MNIVWDEEKNALLKITRKLDFECVAGIIQNHEEITVLENPAHDGQVYYIVKLDDYVHVVPAVIDTDGKIALKTIFPSRKYQKLLGGKHG